MCLNVGLICKKAIQSDDHKSPTGFFFLFAVELYNLWNCHSIVQLIQGGRATWITTAALHTFQELSVLSCFTFVRAAFPADIFGIGRR